jgi:hypothetical protein
VGFAETGAPVASRFEPPQRGRVSARDAATRGSLPVNLGGDALPAHVIERLRAEGVTTLADWRALGARRRRIFAMVRQLDELAQRAGQQ